MEILCKSCAVPIPAGDINIERAIAKCSRCNAVFSFAGQFPPGGAVQPYGKPEVSLPKGLKVKQGPNEISIHQRWMSSKYIAFTIFLVFWNGFLLYWYVTAFLQREWGMMLFGLIFACIGIGVTYSTVAGFLNTTIIRVNSNGFDVRHGPVPMRNINRLVLATLDQVFCKEIRHRGKDSVWYTYDVCAMTKDGREEKIMAGLDSADQALFMEQAIERYLGINDRHVLQEMRAAGASGDKGNGS